MSITPRSEEVAHVAALIEELPSSAGAVVLGVLKLAESDKSPYTSHADMVADILGKLRPALTKDVLKAAFEALTMRDTYAVALGYETVEGARRGHYFGPYGSQAEAQKSADRMAGAGFERRVVSLAAPGQLEGLWEGTDWPGFCTCRHAQGEHRMAGTSRGPCALQTCSCKKFTDASAKRAKAAKRPTKGNAS